jgi:hypothetical protein
MGRIGVTLVLLSVAMFVIGGSYFTAKSGWDPPLNVIGGLSFFLWWLPGLIGVVLFFISGRRPPV